MATSTNNHFTDVATLAAAVRRAYAHGFAEPGQLRRATEAAVAAYLADPSEAHERRCRALVRNHDWGLHDSGLVRVREYWSHGRVTRELMISGEWAIRVWETGTVTVRSLAARADAALERGRARKRNAASRQQRHALALGQRAEAVRHLRDGLHWMPFVDGQQGGRLWYGSQWWSAPGLARAAGVELQTRPGTYEHDLALRADYAAPASSSRPLNRRKVTPLELEAVFHG